MDYRWGGPSGRYISDWGRVDRGFSSIFRTLFFTYVGGAFFLYNDRALMSKFLWFVRCAICFIQLDFFINVMVMVLFATMVTVIGLRLELALPNLFVRREEGTVRCSIGPNYGVYAFTGTNDGPGSNRYSARIDSVSTYVVKDSGRWIYRCCSRDWVFWTSDARGGGTCQVIELPVDDYRCGHGCKNEDSCWD